MGFKIEDGLMRAEQAYWYEIIEKYYRDRDYKYPAEAAKATLDGTAHDDFEKDPTLHWPVLRWRKLEVLCGLLND